MELFLGAKRLSYRLLITPALAGDEPKTALGGLWFDPRDYPFITAKFL